MDYNIPKHITPKSILMAKRFSDSALSMDLYPGKARWKNKADYLFFCLTNKYGHIIVIYCSPYCYFMEYRIDDDHGNIHTEYAMVKNIRHQLFKIKRKGFYDCEHLNEAVEE